MKVTVKTGFALFVISKSLGMNHIGMGYELTKANIPIDAPYEKLAVFGEGAIDSIDNPCYNELTCQVKGENYTCYRMSNKLKDEILKGIEKAEIENIDFTSFKDWKDLIYEIQGRFRKVTPWYEFEKHMVWCDPYDNLIRGDTLFTRYRKNVITEEYVKELKYKYSDVEYEGKDENDPFDWWVINATNYFHNVWFHHHYTTPWEVRQRAWKFIAYLGDEAEYEKHNPTKVKKTTKRKTKDTDTETKPKKTRRKKEKEV